MTTWACLDGSGITGSPAVTGIDILPRYQLLPIAGAAPPVDRVRLRATDVRTSEIVGSSEVEVDPLADAWALSLGVDLGGAWSISVVVEAELLSAGAVEWSGRAGPLPVTSGPGGGPQTLDVLRGPLDNLDAVAIELPEAPVRLLAGTSFELSADLTVTEGSAAEPVVFWASANPAVVSVSGRGPSTTLSAALPGLTTIYAVAGRAMREVSLEVVVPTPGVVVSAPTSVLAGLGLTTRLQALVTDAFGDPAPGASVVWRASDEAVVTVDADGLATAVGFGSATVEAVHEGVSGSASLSVLGPDLVATAVAVVPDAGALISLPSATAVQIDVRNAGAGPAGASTLAVRVLDATTGEAVLPEVGLAVPVLAADEGYSLPELGGLGGLGVELPRFVRLEVVVDTGDGVPETDETNNTWDAGTFEILQAVGPSLSTVVTWLGGDSAGPTDWANPANWSTGAVPLATDSVLVAATSVGPVLSADASAAHLVVGAGATLTIVSGTLTVVGDLTVGGALTVPQDGAIDVNGTLTARLGSTLEVEGTLSADGGCDDFGATILGAGSQPCEAPLPPPPPPPPPPGPVTWLGGDSGGPGDWANPGNWSTGARPASTDSVRVPVTTISPTLTGAEVVAALTVDAGALLDLAQHGLTVTGDVRVDGEVSDGLTTVSGSGASLEGRFDRLLVEGDRSPSGGLAVSGDLVIRSAVLDLAGHAVQVGGDVLVEGVGGRLVMRTPGDALAVAGRVTFDGDSHVGLLSEGTLTVGGDFTATGRSATGFVSQGTHTVIFDTPQPANISLATPGPTQQRFANVTFRKSGVVTALSDLAVVGQLDVQPGAVVDASGRSLWLGGSLVDDTGSLAVSRLYVYGAVSALPPSLAADVFIETDLALLGDLAVTGDVTLDDATLVVGSRTLRVSGDLNVVGAGGTLLMQDASGVVDVEGGVSFDGASHTGALTAGTLFVGGDFVATASSATGFVASGTHGTVLDGAVAQRVDLARPGTSEQRFHDLAIGPGGVDLAGPLVVAGALSADGAAFTRAGSSAAVDARGVVSLDEVTMSGVPLRVVSSADPALHSLHLVTFELMDPADVQLHLELPGRLTAFVELTSLSFDSPGFTAGAHVRTERLGGTGPLTVLLTDTSPGLLQSVILQGLNTLVTWR